MDDTLGRDGPVHHHPRCQSRHGQTGGGSGIILDDFHNSQGGSTAGNYTDQTLLENNLVAFNGGDGIATDETDNATVRHNTVVFNNTDPLNLGTWRGVEGQPAV